MTSKICNIQINLYYLLFTYSYKKHKGDILLSGTVYSVYWCLLFDCSM